MRTRLGKFSLGFGIAVLPLVLLEGDSVRAPGVSIPAGSVPSFAGNPQHTAVYQPAVPSLNRIRWSATIDLNNTGSLAHYGAPLVTAANTVFAPVKIAGDAFRVDAFDGVSGTAKYSVATDYILPAYGWIPVYNPCLTTGAFGTRLYYAGAIPQTRSRDSSYAAARPLHSFAGGREQWHRHWFGRGLRSWTIVSVVPQPHRA